MSTILESIAPTVKPAVQQSSRPDLPPLTPQDIVSIWVKSDVNEETGEITSVLFRTTKTPVGKIGAGLNAAIDRVRASYAKRENKGYNDLEGYDLLLIGVEPSV